MQVVELPALARRLRPGRVLAEDRLPLVLPHAFSTAEGSSPTRRRRPRIVRDEHCDRAIADPPGPVVRDVVVEIRVDLGDLASADRAEEILRRSTALAAAE